MPDESEVLIQPVTDVHEVRAWLQEQGLTFNDYSFLGRASDGRMLFRFKEKRPAMLFKLTFGG